MTAPASYTTPLVLHGNVIANPNSDAVVPNASLANPLGLPMEILEIRFRIVPLGTTPEQAPVVTGMGLGVKMDLGKAAVVDGYVPVGDLAPVRDSYEYQSHKQQLTVGGNLTDVYPMTYGWRLKYPLLVPAGAALSCVLRPLGQNASALSVDVIYIARTWDASRALPRVTKVPWVASYESKGFDFNEDAEETTDDSYDLDIVNPFAVPLELARIGGRVASLSPSYTTTGGTTYTDVLAEDAATARAVYGSIEMRSSRGFDLTRKATPFAGLFPYNWRAWDMAAKWVMAPREFYKVRLNMAAADAYVPESATLASIDPTQFQFSVGVTGYRDVPVNALVEE